MKVTTKPPEPVKPNIVIELTWDEAQMLREVLGCLVSPGEYAVFVGALWDELGGRGVESRRYFETAYLMVSE